MPFVGNIRRASSGSASKFPSTLSCWTAIYAAGVLFEHKFDEIEAIPIMTAGRDLPQRARSLYKV